MRVEYSNIQAASVAIAQVAFSGQDLAVWRGRQGIENDDLERAAAESADDTMEEIEHLMESGIGFGESQLREFLMREYLTAWQVGWICRARAEQREAAEAEA